MSEAKGGAVDFEVYTVIERDDGESFWQRLGSGWINQDESINVRLNAVPINGRLQLRRPRADD